MFRKVGWSLFLVLSVLLFATAAHAGLAALSYTDTNSEEVTVGPASRWINPTGEISVYLTAGLERRVGYVLLDADEQTVAEGISDGIITGADQFTVLDQTHYGKILTIPAGLSEGDYILRALILDAQGNPVSSQDIALTVDLTPPTAGDLWWHAFGCNHSSIMNNELVGTYEIKNILVEGVRDATGIDRVQFESFDPGSGQVYYSKPAWYDSSAGTAGVGNGTTHSVPKGVYLPAIDGPLGVRFIVYDKAGNRKAAQTTVRYNGIKTPLPELVAVYNPNVTEEFIPGSGLVGYEAYTPGMTTYANPMQLLYRLPRSNWVGDNPDYGLNAVGGEVVYTDAQYAYFRFIGAFSALGRLDVSNFRWTSPKWWSAGKVQFDLALADSAPRSPVMVSWEVNLSGIGWVVEPIAPYQFNTAVAMTKVRVVAEPRDYIQEFSFADRSCTIPAGETECVVDLDNRSPTPGGMTMFNDVPRLENQDGSLSADGKRLITEWDLMPPAVVSYTLDRAGKTITFLAEEPHSGAWWGHVTLASGWVMAYNPATGEEVRINGAVQPLSGDNHRVTANYASLPEGNWQFTLWVQDNFGNTASMPAEALVLDQSAPQVAVYKDTQPLSDHGSVTSIGQIRIALSDNLDQEPELTGIRLEGGPQGNAITLAFRFQGGAYVLEYPVMFPSMGQEYSLVVSARDGSGNTATRTVPFSYDPPQVKLFSTGHDTLNLPALPANVVHANGSNALLSEVIEVGGSPISGTYDLVVVSGINSTISVVVNGMTVAPGEQKNIPAYDFAATGHRLDLPIRSDEPGRADLLVTSQAPNFPVLTASLNFWRPEIQLSAEPGWEVQPLIQAQRINVVKGAGTPCQITMDEQQAQSADPIDNPMCLVRWLNLPSNYQATGNYAEGVLPPTGDYNADYEVYIYNGGQPYLVANGGQALARVPIQDLDFTAQVTPAAASHYRQVQQIDVGMESSGSYRCPLMVTSLAEAQQLGAEQVVCLWRWVSVPEGLEAVSGSGLPCLSGKIAQSGDHQVAWAVDIYSPYGMVENAAAGSLPLSIVDPPLPTLSFEPGIYGEKVDDSLFVTWGLQGGEVGSVKFGTELLQTDMTLELDGTDDGHTSHQYWSARGITFSRYIKTGPLNVWETREVTARLYYTDLPEVTVEKRITVMGVPSSRIRAQLTAPREALDTTGVPVRLAVGTPASGNEMIYESSQDGSWQARFGYLDREREFHPLTDFQPLANGILETTLTGFEVGFQKLIAEVELTPPPAADFYVRSMFSNPVYSVVLKGTAPEGRIFSRTLTGPAPLRSVLSLQVDSDTRRILGDVVWQLSSDGGGSWQDLEIDTPYQARVTVDSGRYLVRAKMTNQLSGAQGYSEGVELIAFRVPELVVSAPQAVIVGTPIILQAQVLVDGQPQADAVVEWYDRARELVHTGSSFDLTPADTQSLVYQVKARLASAPPEDRSAWVNGNVYVRVVPPSPPRGRIVTPSYLEYNTVEAQTYQLTAETDLATGLDPEMYPVKGEWHLPDGRVVEGPEVEYTPTLQDAESRRAMFEYVVWIEGFKEQTLATLRRSVVVWTYSWPDFLVEVKTYPDVAPALVTLAALPESVTPSHLENPTYNWHLPAAAEVVREQDGGRVLQVNFPEPGSFDVRVDIEDARGSTAQAMATVALGEPEPFQVEFLPLYSNPLQREVLDVTLRTRVSGGHPQDRLTEYEFTINAPEAEVTGYSGTGIFKGLRQGDYVAHLRAVSRLGKVVEADFPVTVIANRLPTCEINSWDAGDYRWYKAACTDPDGRIAAWRWYLDDQLISSGRSIRPKIEDITGTLRFEAVDDAGGVYRQNLTPSE